MYDRWLPVLPVVVEKFEYAEALASAWGERSVSLWLTIPVLVLLWLDEDAACPGAKLFADPGGASKYDIVPIPDVSFVIPETGRPAAC